MNRKKLVFLLILTIFTIFLLSDTVVADYPYNNGAEYNDPYYDDDTSYSSNSEDAMMVFMIILIAIIIGVIVWIGVTYWAYRDATNRGQNGILWALVVFFGGIIGIIVWLVVRPPIGGNPYQQSNYGLDPFQKQGNYHNNRICPSCGKPIPFDARICPYCMRHFNKYL